MIELVDLSKNYGAFQALKDINLRVREGEIFGFLGPNGAGKTTTIKIMAGLMKPTSGKARIAGYDICKEPTKAKAQIGLVPDRPFLYEKLTAREFLKFVGTIRGMGASDLEAQMEGLLHTFGLDSWADKLIENFSHGMKQRLVMCAALLHRPKVLIVDEPMVGLDPKGARLVKEIFRKEAQKGVSIFMSTHTLEVAQEMCHRVAILDRGRIVAQGTAEELAAMTGQFGADLEEVFLRLTAGEEEGCL
jgi:ABC-2 type transport system ATP-binding protein